MCKKIGFIMLAVTVGLIAHATAICCTVFTSHADDAVLFGNNEDCENPFARIWFLPAEDGKYGRVYLGFDFLGCIHPQGGINDQGLAFDILAAPPRRTDTPLGTEPYLDTYGNLIVKVMEECATVSEAIALFKRYNIGDNWNGQYFIADKCGFAAIIEVDAIHRKTDSHLVATNFYLSETSTNAYPCWRFKAARTMLRDGRAVSIESYKEILETVHLEGDTPTQYSNIFDLKNGMIYLYHFHDFNEVVVFNVAGELSKGRRSIRISSLFPEKDDFVEYAAAFKEPIVPLLRDAFNEGGIQAAIQNYEHIGMEHDPHYEVNEWLLKVFGWELADENRNDDALKMFQLIASEFPNSDDAQQKLGWAYLRTGRKNQALACYSKSLEMNPNSRTSALMLERLSQRRNEKTAKVDVFWALVGDYPRERKWNPYQLTRDDKEIDTASITYAIRRDYKTAEQISLETEVPLAQVEIKLGELSACRLVREKQGAYIVNFPFWDWLLRDEIISMGMELSDGIVKILKAELPSLVAAFQESSLPQQGFEWDDLSLTIIGGMLLDTGLNDRGLRQWNVFNAQRDTPLRPGNYRYWYRAVENGWGINWHFANDMVHNDSRDLWFGMFFGSSPGRRIKWSRAWDVFDNNTKSILFPLIDKGAMEKDALRRSIRLPGDKFDEVLNDLENAQIVRVDGSGIYPNFPIFREDDINNLLSRIDAVCNQIITGVYQPYLPEIHRAWMEIAPPNWEIENLEKFFIREVFNTPYNITLGRLIKEGVLPPSPVEPPFNYWAIKGHFKLL